MLILRWTVYNFVGIALIGNKDMHLLLRVGGRLEGAHGDADPVFPICRMKVPTKPFLKGIYMIKYFLSVFTLSLLGTQSFATQVPGDQLQGYKDAVDHALRTQGIDSSRCIAKGPYNIYVGQAGYIDDNPIEAMVNQMTQVDKTDGTQPLLQFSKNSLDHSLIMYVTTTSDFLKILSLHIVESQSKTAPVEKGNLKSPDMEMIRTWNVTGVVDCK